mmetsp:Transcript_13283/g.27544  ORF Transcript_13283/g.27544 Transcript_13283/m.27544 type:complete len:327 (-) Transcript_13283:107-1087(-)|eukprot:CAMPEP_0172454396 /NCGR_PEP_ID=MMETSP1065-20121228/11400_1 /TAXON_ID=265537 /ORGANISM="Amphiprora paludosa, Strain CCMP125" /LENGTH=326 /DNA_ID=CAMNT_0013206719 /DNA_START=68 /DNA_END=1048 /DNA_ORIENTATION=-
MLDCSEESTTFVYDNNSQPKVRRRKRTSVTSVRVDGCVSIIPKHAFSFYERLKSVDMAPQLVVQQYSISTAMGVERIEDGAFEFCESLETIRLPNSLTFIGDHAFRNCSSLTRIRIPESVTHIGTGAFAGCKSLESVILPSRLNEIPSGCFMGCGQLTRIEIPSSVVSIGDGAFCRCDSLKTAVFPESLTTIGVGAFRCCTSLQEIHISSSVNEIGDMAFYRCPASIIRSRSDVSAPSKMKSSRSILRRPIERGMKLLRSFRRQERAQAKNSWWARNAPQLRSVLSSSSARKSKDEGAALSVANRSTVLLDEDEDHSSQEFLRTAH